MKYIFTITTLFIAISSFSQMNNEKKIGDKITNFSGIDENGKEWNSSNIDSNFLVVYFYPAAMTGGCTKQACSIRDNFRAISAQGYKVFGVSPDNVKKHNKFINKYEFQYDLLADPDKKMINDFGVIGPKKFMGREIIGVYRTSFFVDESGKIEHIIDKVKTKDHGLQILDYLSNVQ